MNNHSHTHQTSLTTFFMYYVENFFREKSIIIIYFNFIFILFCLPQGTVHTRNAEHTHLFIFPLFK